ncbi:D-2-hydroxyacid dehydrogenase [uncultured Parolsenella sp.]|uniref:D-2-hydroxyacid dehydrogenase n=1 Tax=uncultured Parolsenella sp. TaxID=2083008 RepID=UPI0025DF8AB3|nr:D-2-hydroxyacid dehydrogenase [uncultured Parolsenella sp.]
MTASNPLDVLVLLPLTDEQRARLEAGAPGARYTYVAPTSSLDVGAPSAEQVAEANVIVGNVSPALLGHAANLRLLQLNSAGYDNYISAGTIPTAAALACAVGAYGQAVSEHLFAMMLSLMKCLPAYQDCQRKHNWADLGPVTTFDGARVLVLGTGDIGGHFARLCAGMGATVVGANRHGGEAPASFSRVVTMDALAAELAEADVVASFLPSTPATRGLANEKFFSVCKPGAYFANGGRGDLVVADALVAALESERLAGAALDVTAPEPLPADHPFWDTKNLLLTPHVSGGFHMACVLDNIVGIAAENLAHLAAGEPIRNLVRH